MGTMTIGSTKPLEAPLSPRLLLVVLCRLERRKAAAAQAWEALRGDLRNEDKMRGYVVRLRQCEALRAAVVGNVDCMKN
jgi:hypothetical protein